LLKKTLPQAFDLVDKRGPEARKERQGSCEKELNMDKEVRRTGHNSSTPDEESDSKK